MVQAQSRHFGDAQAGRVGGHQRGASANSMIQCCKEPRAMPGGGQGPVKDVYREAV